MLKIDDSGGSNICTLETWGGKARGLVKDLKVMASGQQKMGERFKHEKDNNRARNV